MSQRFVITRDNRILASGFEVGRIHEHPTMSSAGSIRRAQPSKWFAVEAEHGIVDIVSDRTLAALQVARAAGYPNAVITDVDEETPE